MRKVHGLEQVENFFSSISERLKGFQVHVALPNCYAHENSVEKAEVLMQKMREMDIGEKDEIYRIWNRYKEMGIIYNKGYKTLISALLKLDQVEGAEKIFEEWHSKKLSYDTRIPKLLIDVYSQKGLLDNQIPKAMEAMKKAISVCLPGAGRKPSKETLAACLKYLEGKGDIE
ncbi:PREDICTED: pentatricopeptide repeat-containing protein At2g20710, mitochondrial [Theobroma cacao]|uniref:Pentatricopeptide repeat-containing protein At2g20710, mitochondrial n=1 Tax=Theobroma cacao TaxID=3641 RepID=A0AB32WK58_THECC|nr:PREDICTED: pentatricopeptide repeat-containing protein At2g20710, mitochondrial [Theobroma cacao]